MGPVIGQQVQFSATKECARFLRINNALFPFLVQSALLGWLWELPTAKELRHYGAMALWRYGAMVLPLMFV